MTVEIKLIPDGISKIPAELSDDGIVATYLQDISVPEQAPIDSWRQIEREVPGDESHYILRVKGVSLSDVPDKMLTQTQQAITNQVAGVKASERGWQEVDGSDNLPANR